MDASTTQFPSHPLAYAHQASSYSPCDTNGVPSPTICEDPDNLARLWSYAMTDEPSMYDRPSSMHQTYEFGSAEHRQPVELSLMVDPIPLLSMHPSDVSIPPGFYDIGSYHDRYYTNMRLHFQYGATQYDALSIHCHPTISPSAIAPRQPEAFSVPCVAPTLTTSLVPDAPGSLPVHHSPIPEPSGAHHHRHIPPPHPGDMHSTGSSASPLLSSYSLSPSPEPAQSRPHLVISKRRNVHVPTPSPTRGSSSPTTSTATATTTMRTNRWKCPYCPHVQRNRRSPDLKRHIATHTRSDDDASWVCCGVPMIDALECGVPGASVREENVYEHNGMFMIGGCRKTFSRKDAYVRHLRREKGKCFGDADAPYQAGNCADMGEM